jgi:hypothetical protein
MLQEYQKKMVNPQMSSLEVLSQHNGEVPPKVPKTKKMNKKVNAT